MDEMRKYRVTFTKVVLAVTEEMAETIASEHVRKMEYDKVSIACTCLSTADRLTPKGKRIPIHA